MTTIDELVERLQSFGVTIAASANGIAVAKEAATALITARADIERLTRERDEAREAIVEANNSLFGSQGFFLSLNGGNPDKYHLATPIEELKTSTRKLYRQLSDVKAERDQLHAELAAAQTKREYTLCALDKRNSEIRMLETDLAAAQEQLMTALPDLSHFIGTERWFRHQLNPKVTYTEGVQYLAEKVGAYWLIDEIALTQLSVPYVGAEDFQAWKLAVHVYSTATLTCEDGDGFVVFTKQIDFTDFPGPGITLWCVNNVILLPSEY